MAQQVTIVGTMTDSEGKTQQVTINGIGQILVDPSYGVPAPPPHAAHPIVPGPVDPGYGIPGPPPQPAHPIVLPPTDPPPIDPPEVPPGLSPPPGWSWFYTQRFRWVLIWIPPAGGGKPMPPSSDRPTVTPHKG